MSYKASLIEPYHISGKLESLLISSVLLGITGLTFIQGTISLALVSLLAFSAHGALSFYGLKNEKTLYGSLAKDLRRTCEPSPQVLVCDDIFFEAEAANDAIIYNEPSWKESWLSSAIKEARNTRYIHSMQILD